MTSTRRRLRLAARVESLFGDELRAWLLAAVTEEEAILRVGDGEEFATRLPVAGPGWREVAASHDLADLLTSEVTLATTNGELRRSARGMLLLRFHEQLGAFVECSDLVADEVHLMLGDSKAVAEVLDQVADRLHEPATRHDEMPGLPSGWMLVTGVLPVSTLSLTDSGLEETPDGPVIVLHGGRRLPGPRRRFHLTGLPAVRVAAAAGRVVTVRVQIEGSEEVVWESELEATDEGARTLLSVSEIGGDGDYRVVAATDEGPLGAATLRVRSGDTLRDLADDSHERSGRLGRVAGDSRSLLSAVPTSEPDVVGGWLQGGSASRRTLRRDDTPRRSLWTLRWPNEADADNALQPPGESSRSDCDDRRGHFIVYEPPSQRGAHLRGTCARCGRPRRCAATTWDRNAEELVIDGDYEPIEPPRGVNLDVAMDMLSHLGHGPWPWFERVVRDMGGDALSVRQAARRLEAHGHLEIERDDGLRPQGFRVAPPALVRTALKDTAVLVGRRSPSIFRDLSRAARPAGAGVSFDKAQQPTRVVVKASDEVLGRMAEALEGKIAISPRLDGYLAGGWARAGIPVGMLPASPLPSGAWLDLYDLTSGSWCRSQGNRPGAYRLKQFGRRTYGLRTPEDVTTGQIRMGPHGLVRHLAARQAEVALVAYEPTTQTLFAPWNVGLPGMLERAAVMCSGRFPVKAPWRRAWAYRSVPRGVADLITTTLNAGGSAP